MIIIKCTWIKNNRLCRLFILFSFILFTLPGFGQKNTCHLQGTVQDKESKEVLEFTTVSLKNDTIQLNTVSDKNGRFSFRNIKPGTYTLSLSFIGYLPLHRTISIHRDTTLSFHMQIDTITLQDIIVTASESRGLTSSSKINREAMNLLQPSSFTDILSLLPGGMTKDPSLGSVNKIRLREGGVSSSDYDVTSLGVSFLIDGIPLSTDANMQQIPGSYQGEYDYNRNSIGKGVDTRTLSTDFIQSVEVIRGIPSVEYGELTSGLVKITRKAGVHPWEIRLKTDAGSKLVYAGKGLATRNGWTINFGIDYMDSKIDPRNNLETFKRLTGSVRIGRTWNILTWNLNADYGSSFDNAKNDPELSHKKIDKYKSTYNRMALANSLYWNFTNNQLLKSLSLSAAIDYSKDQIKRTKYISLDKDTPIPDNTEEGEHDGIFLPYRYTAHLKVDGQPLNAYSKAMGELGFNISGVENAMKIGAEWRMNKNLGKGQVYNLTRPLYPSMKARPRPYDDIPAEHTLAFFIEDRITVPVGTHNFQAAGGVRTLTPLNIDKEYKINGKTYFDPRVNLLWKFPTTYLFNRILNIQLAGGIGWNTKMPVMTQLYPDTRYVDLTQLNYYHTNEEYRRLNMMTYKVDVTNFKLEPARNRKWEVRFDFDYSQNNFSMTYFREKMTSGFRTSSFWRTFDYKKYDASALDPGSIQTPPDINTLPYSTDTVIYTFGQTTNGSMIIKEGIEYQYTSKRIESIRTKITINGAWFKSTYHNSHPVYRNESTLINGAQIKYVALYPDDDGYIKQQFNTNFAFDTYIRPLGLSFATFVQCLWISSQQSKWKSGTPLKYVSIDGIEHDFTADNLSDPVLQYLVKQYNKELFIKRTDPISISVHFKATKKFMRDKINLSLFVNNILDYNPDYKENNLSVRHYVTPYFGMELNLNL